MFDLDLIIPFYNPPNNWEKNLFKSLKKLENSLNGVSISLILVNDGSTQFISEKSIFFLKEKIKNFHYIYYDNNKGKGYALREGVKFSKSPFQIITDIDFPYTNLSVLSVYNTLTEGQDVVVGVRDKQYYNNKPFVRVFISKCFRFILKYFFRLDINDTQCGLKGFGQNGKNVFLETEINTFLFDLEFVLLSKKRGVSICDVKVIHRKDILLTTLRISTIFREVFNFIRIIFISYK